MARPTWVAPPLRTATGGWLLILGLPGWTAWSLDALVWVLVRFVVFEIIVREAGARGGETRGRRSAPPRYARRLARERLC